MIILPETIIQVLDCFAPLFSRRCWPWVTVLVVGAILGSFASAALSGDLRPEWVPQRWAAAFGPEPLPRILTAFVGGIFMGLGARWAGGCTSGHGISGTLQLAVSSWIAVILFFGAGILSAALVSWLAASGGQGC